MVSYIDWGIGYWKRLGFEMEFIREIGCEG
jgi:hypothetical protein